MILILMMLCLIIIPFNTYGGSEYRIGGTFSFQLTEKTNFTLSEELKWVSNRPGLAYHHTDFGLSFITKPLWTTDKTTIGFNYRQVYGLRQDGSWAEENRPYLSLTPQWNVDPFTFKLSNAIEYRHLPNTDTWRYRVQPVIQHVPSGLFVASKISYNISSTDPKKDGQWDNNELDFGISRPLFKNVSGTLWYRFTQVHYYSSGWKQDSEMIGLDIKLSF